MGKAKNLKRPRRVDEDEDVLSDEEVTKPSKKTKKTKTSASASANSGKDDDGNSWWSLGGTRRITISGFKGKTYVNIREYYTDASGDLKPGKKGIMLTPEQYNALLESIPAINAELQSKGHATPDISSSSAAAVAADSPKKATSKDKQAKKKKANIEATSEEDDDDDEEDSD
ncbi:transcriptional Coactivator p15-domain-containing protein [Biscogniauxia mediterranea]|nr:transcriptional Coactivator p15-domain-containing protein [Biscogniauxia mediterranea]